MTYQDILYEEKEGAVTITINRPKVYNAFRPETCVELIDAFGKAGWDDNVGVIVLTGAGTRAFCTGGDQSGHDGQYGDGSFRGAIGMPVEEMQSVLRDIPKPVIAKVRGYSIGGGNILATLCDLTIAAESAIFGQVGPKVGSVDGGFGTAYLSRIIGEKKAREMWYLCRRYTARQALEMGLVNAVVPDDALDAEVESWCAEIVQRSPTSIAVAKRAFNADSENIRGFSALGMQTLKLFYNSAEGREGAAAFREKRPPNFRKAMMQERNS